MNGFYTVTESLKNTLKAKGFRVITLGDNFKVDIARQTIFPYAHIIPDSATKTGNITTWTFRIIGMDLVIFSKDNIKDLAEPFYTSDNLQDVLNDIQNRLSQVVELYERGSESLALNKLYSDVTFTPFLERYENLVAGWEISITLTLPTGGSIC